MSDNTPSWAALLGLLAVAGYQNRDKIGALLQGMGAASAGRDSAATSENTAPPAGRRGEADGLDGLSAGLDSLLRGGFGGGAGGLSAGGLGGLLGNGLRDLVGHLQNNGLGPQTSSWIAQGPNQEVSAGQLRQAIDPALIDQMAQQTGLSREDLLQRLATVLPDAVDAMTPQGRLPPLAGPT